MRVIDHRQFETKRGKKRRLQKKLLYKILFVSVVVFVAVNGIFGLLYRDRVLPNYSLGKHAVGGMKYDEIGSLGVQDILPSVLLLKKGSASKELTVQQLGISVDIAASVKDLKEAKPLLPLVSLFTDRTISVTLALDEQRFGSISGELSQYFTQAPQPSHVVLSDVTFAAASPTPGYKLDVEKLRGAIYEAVPQGATQIIVPTMSIPAPMPVDITAEVQTLQKQLATKLQFGYNGRTIQPDQKTVAGWYVPVGQTMSLAQDRIASYVDSIALNAANRNDLVLAAMYALRKEQPITLAVAPAGRPVHTYCAASRGLPEIDRQTLIGKLATTYADSRGWNGNGARAFQYVESGCAYTVWLSAPAQMATFGDICDEYYSCQVGSNVIINNDRWEAATTPWNEAGRSVEDYRTLVINHETGHQLAFLDNNVCPAAGGPAPVMMQQSIDLLGCTFNEWPTAIELATVND